MNHNKFSWINPKLEVRDTGTYGKSVFAKEDIKKDEKLVIFGGYIMTLNEEEKLPREIAGLAHQIDDDLVIDIKKENKIQEVDILNHNCNPNAGFRGQNFLVAMRGIELGEKITFDYAMTDVGSIELGQEDMSCLCKSKDCRGKITSKDWKINELQNKYRGHFSRYIQDLIDTEGS